MDNSENVNGLGLGGVWKFECYRDGKLLWEEEGDNLITDEGLDHVLDTVLHGSTPVSTWYIALIGTNSTPAAGWVYTGIGTNFTEFTNYSETTRQAYVEAASASQSVTNSANKAKFTCSADTQTVYGAALVSDSTKGDNTSGPVLLSAKLFSASKALDTNDELYVTYTVNASST